VQSTRHDANLAALQASTALPGHVVDVVVLSDDAGLLATLREASSPEHAIWHAVSADLAVDLLVGGRCGILIADLGTLRGDAASLLDRLHAQFPELIMLTTGRRDEEGAVASLVSDGRIYRFLHKPISPARANVFISAATRRYNELRSVEPIGLTTVKMIAARAGSNKTLVAAIAALLVLIALAIGWLRGNSHSGAPLQSQISVSARHDKIADLLAQAQKALTENRLSAPRGDNALDYFRAALALQPDHQQAQEGVDRVVATLEQHVVEALQARNAQQGAIALTALQHAVPDDPRLEPLHAELLAISRSVRPPSIAHPPRATATPTKSRTSSPPPVAKTPAPVADESASSSAAKTSDAQATIDSAAAPAAASSVDVDELALVIKLRERGVLIEPAGSNAYDQFVALRERYPGAEEIRTEEQKLAFTLLERTRTALAAEDVDAATESLTRVETLVPGMSTTKSLQQQLAAASQKRDFTRNVVPAATLKRTREASPVYPRDAQRNNVQGWVDVEFTIAPDGTTQDLIVRAAEPADIFEKAALESVQRWRFEPILRNGVASSQRASLRVRFVLK
jgi:TonB family protein